MFRIKWNFNYFGSTLAVWCVRLFSDFTTWVIRKQIKFNILTIVVIRKQIIHKGNSSVSSNMWFSPIHQFPDFPDQDTAVYKDVPPRAYLKKIIKLYTLHGWQQATLEWRLHTCLHSAQPEREVPFPNCQWGPQRMFSWRAARVLYWYLREHSGRCPWAKAAENSNSQTFQAF